MTALKRRANVTVDAALLERSKALGINLSRALEERLAELVRAAEAERWKQDNAEGLRDARDFTARHGVFGDGLRRF